MTNKKELNNEELEKVAGGYIATRWCYFCNKETELKTSFESDGNEVNFQCICAECGKPYNDGFGSI